MRGLLDTLRHWFSTDQSDALARAWMADKRREYAARMLAQATDLTACRDDLLRFASAAEHYADRCRLYCQALAADLRAEACRAAAGGDHETAARHRAEADEYDRHAQQWGAPKPVPAEPAEAAHA
jgi:hypothetical protein